MKKIGIIMGFGRRIGIGFVIDKYSLTIDFFCWWVAVEW